MYFEGEVGRKKCVHNMEQGRFVYFDLDTSKFKASYMIQQGLSDSNRCLIGQYRTELELIFTGNFIIEIL